VRLTNAIQAAGTQAGLIYGGSVNSAVAVNGQTVIPAGSVAEIEVARFEKPDRSKGGGKLDVTLKNLTIAGRKYTLSSDEFEVAGAARAKKPGRFGVIGSVAGGVAHGVKDAVGVGGAAAAEMNLAADTLLSFHLTSPLTLVAP